MGVWSLHILYSLNLNGGLGRAPVFGYFGDILGYQNNPFLGMSQPKFCLKTYETCLLLLCYVYVSVLIFVSFLGYAKQMQSCLALFS